MKFRKKPVVVEAVQLPDEGEDVSAEFLNFLSCKNPKWKKVQAGGVLFYTGEGDSRADPLDWIIRGENGELSSCKPDIFNKTYELVDDRDPR